MVHKTEVDKATNQDEQGPQTTCRKWKANIHRAVQAQKKWVKEADSIMKIYRNENDGAKSSPLFNILAANTDTLKPAVYNSTPKADIRRRFRKDDPVGKAISEILQNVIEYENDVLNFDDTINMVILDTLLPGRGVAIVEYEPVITRQLDEAGNEIPIYDEDEGDDYDEAGDLIPAEPVQTLDNIGQPMFMEEVSTESTPTKHIQYQDFIHGTGQEWKDIDWIGIRYHMTKKECKEMFPETYENIQSYSNIDDDLQSSDRDMNAKMKTAEVWKIWDKVKRQVCFINDSSMIPLKTEEDPLGLEGFYPCPKPLMFKKDQTSLNPIPPYRMYKEQAEELNRVISKRNAIIAALKVRGVYDASLGTDVPKMLNSGNMELIPIRNKQQIEAAGGIGNAIWFMPIADLANTLNQLYEAEARIKNTIYEITGLADIMRGATTPGSQTATEQRIKSQWGSLRIQDLQRDIQRLAKDIFKIKSEIMAEHYQPQTLIQISGVQIPPEAAQPILQTLRDDKLRAYKIDIETDSTIQETIDRDMQGMSEVLGGIAELFNSLGPVVQAGAMPIEALQQLALGFIRKARLGRDVEDYFAEQGMMQQPEDPEAVQQAEQMQADADTVLQAATRINEENQQQISEIAQGKLQYEKLVAESQDYMATANALNQIVQDLQASKGVDSQAIRALREVQLKASATTEALREVQNNAAVTTDALTQQMAVLEDTVNTPKGVVFNRDDKGKITGAVSAPLPPRNGA